MGDHFLYPVYFECPDLLPGHKNAVERYFRNHRKSGGGADSGPLRKDKDGVYSIAFMNQKDQREVLRRKNHEVESGNTSLNFTVHEAQVPRSPFPQTGHGQQPPVRPKRDDGTTSKTVACSSLPPSGELHEVQVDSLKREHVALQLGENKLRLLWRQLEHSLQREFPKVKVTREEGGQLVLEGSEADVLEAYEFITEQDSMVVERKISNFNPGYLAFWKTAYGTPGMLSDYLRLDVEIEIQEKELRIFSFSTESLDETELALQREFDLKEFPYKDLIMLCSLTEKVEPTMQKINREGCRVNVITSSGNIFYLVGHSKEVEELTEEVSKLVFEYFEEVDQTSKSIDFGANTPQPSISYEPTPQPSSLILDQEEAEVVARYCLSDELEVFLCLGDITKQEADAIVNSANEDLKHSRGVASALSEAGGPEVQMESSILVKNNGKVSTGDVVVTSGGQLRCKKLLHAVGPANGKAGGRESAIIQKVITSALNLCEIMEFRSIALPCISSGLFGVPIDVCAEAIVRAVQVFGAVGGRTLTKITLIDKRSEVVESLRAQCDRLLRGEAAGDTEGCRSLESPTEAAPRISRRNVRVEIVQGTIENQQVDAVVSPMLSGEPRTTRVGNCLYETVGQQLQDLYLKQDGEKMPGDSVLVEGLTGAPFSAVFFVDLLPWDNDCDGTPIEVMKLAISNVLTSCENQGYTSVAFPVLGAGVLLKFPEEIVAEVLHQEISSFNQRRTSTTPFLVNIVCPPETFISIKGSLEHPISQESEAKRIILLGKTGSGKSSLGNTILGENVFVTDDGPNSGTKRCQSKTKTVNGRKITLIDTPGLFDSECTEEELMPEVLSCITECTPGPHAFLIVLKVEKFSEQEQAIITKICQYFSEEALQYATVVFTHGDQLPKGTDIETFIRQSKRLSELVRKCGNRCHVVDNMYWNTDVPDPYRNNEVQVESLLKTIDKMMMSNNWGFYTNKAFNVMEKHIEKEEAIIKENDDSMSKEEIRIEAKKRVSSRWLTCLVGMGTGALLGAIFGFEALVRLVITAVQNKAAVTRAKQLTSAIGYSATGDAALTVAGVATGAAVLGGGIAGGVIGVEAADGAESIQDAYEKAKKAVMAIRDKTWNALK